ncbi:TPA: hypothetical protein ACGO2J_002176 [Streptococcus suis]
MKKTFFQKTYSIIETFFFLGITSMFLYIGVLLLKISIDTISIEPLDNFISIFLQYLSIFLHYLKFLTYGILMIPIMLLLTEFLIRIRKDNFWNYFKSLHQTRHLRQFLKQEEKSESVISIDDQTTVTKLNPILVQFNQTIDKCLVDVRNKSVIIYLQYPKTQQAQKLLRDMKEHIKEEVSNQNPNYYFSAPTREGNSLWYIGTRR